MSLSRSCEGCPFNTGFEAESGRIIKVCSDPSQRCIEMRDKLLGQIATWNRMAANAESNRTGILKFSQLTLGDYLHITSSTPEHAGAGPEREFRVRIDDIRDNQLVGVVVVDTYTEDGDLDRQFYAVPTGSDVILYGAFERQGDEDNDWSGISIPGELHVGRYVEYGPPGENSSLGLLVHDIALIDEEQNLSMTIFDADPDEQRPPPPLP